LQSNRQRNDEIKNLHEEVAHLQSRLERSEEETQSFKLKFEDAFTALLTMTEMHLECVRRACEKEKELIDQIVAAESVSKKKLEEAIEEIQHYKISATEAKEEL